MRVEEAEHRKEVNKANAEKAMGRAVEMAAGSMEGYAKK